MGNPQIDRLAAGKYISLTTFKRDGTPVATPVWCALDGDHLVVITDPASGKAKRIRNSGRVLLAPCDGRGKLKGPSVEGTAVLTDAAGSERVKELIATRYGVMGRAIGLFQRLRGRSATAHVGIVVTVP